MKFKKQVLLVLLIFLNPILVKAQNLTNFEKLLINEWSLESYEIDGVKMPPKEGHESDKMVFDENHKATSISSGISQIGTWQFTKENGQLLVVDDTYNLEMKFKVVSCDENSCVLDLLNPEQQKIRLYMVAKKEK